MEYFVNTVCREEQIHVQPTFVLIAVGWLLSKATLPFNIAKPPKNFF